jgi:flavin reductase (DIM6/NTAB) family NADH-FMN oxidoreductase RutF
LERQKSDDMDVQERIDKAFLILPPRLTVMVSTRGKDESINTAPYCEFSKLYGNFMVIGMDKKRDSLKNLRETKECVVSLLPISLAEKISIAGKPYPYGVSEFEKAGLTAEKASKVKAQMIKEAIVNFECVLHDIMENVGESVVVVVKIVDAHFDEKQLKEDEAETRTSSKAAFHVSKGRVFWSMDGKTIDTGIDVKKI